MLDTPSQVTIILVTYNSKAVVGMALKSIPKGIPVIVVDNASSDGTPNYIYEHFPSVTIINNKQNIGFGPANNIALEQIETPFSLLMNPDACFTDPVTIDGLLEAAERYPEAAILGPEIVDENGVRQLTLPAPLKYRKEINRRTQFSMNSVSGDACTFSLSGALMLLRMDAFANVDHFFDPNIFMYFEDDEICMSCYKRGYSSMLIPSLSVMHIAGTSTPPSNKIEAFKLRHKTFSMLYVMGKYDLILGNKKRAYKVAMREGIAAVLYTLFFSWKRALFARNRMLGATRFIIKNDRI